MIKINRSIYENKLQIIKNIEQRLLDWQHLTFENWYQNANRDLFLILESVNNSCQTYHNLAQVAAVCSVLSPASKWDQNLKDTEKLFIEFYSDQVFSYTTYGSNVTKARDLIRSGLENPVEIIERFFKSAPKTRDFYKCLLNPQSQQFVIDRHMLTIAGISNEGRMSPKQYEFIQDCYGKAFSYLCKSPIYEVFGRKFGHYSSAQIQAHLWCAYQYYFKNTKH